MGEFDYENESSTETDYSEDSVQSSELYGEGSDYSDAGDQSVIPPDQPGGPGYEPEADQSVIPADQPGGPGYEADADQSVIPADQPGGPGYEADADQSVIPADQPGGPGYEPEADQSVREVESPVATLEEPEPSYDDEGNPALVDLATDGESEASVGTWWAATAPPSQCCVPLMEPSAEQEPTQGLTFSYTEGEESLPGDDSNSDGIADFAQINANQVNDQIDTWLLDSTGSGTADKMYFDCTGNGMPNAVCMDSSGTGEWSQPMLLPEVGTESVIPTGQPGGPDPTAILIDDSGSEQSVIPTGQPGGPDPTAILIDDSGSEQSVIPTGQPGGPGYIDLDAAFANYTPGDGANLQELCDCTDDPVAKWAIAAIALAETSPTVEPTPAPPPVLDPASDTETAPPVYDGNLEDLTQQGLPDDWADWTPQTEGAPESFTDSGYSTDWGTVEPDWSQQDQSPFPVSEPEQPIATIIGPGHADDLYWAAQGQTNYCGIYSVRAILSEVYGYDVDANEMVTRADQNGWLVRDVQGQIEGIYPRDIPKIFASYGVASHERSGEDGAWQALNDAMTNNQRIVISIDSKEIDAGTNVGDQPGIDDSDHFVSIEGIDYAKGVVIVNDSARHAGLEIPTSVFYDAWRDSNFDMTITDVSPAGGPAGGSGGYSLLGATIQARTAA